MKLLAAFLATLALAAQGGHCQSKSNLRLWSPYYGMCLGLGRTTVIGPAGSDAAFVKEGPGARLQLEKCDLSPGGRNQLFTLALAPLEFHWPGRAPTSKANAFLLSAADHRCVGMEAPENRGSGIYTHLSAFAGCHSEVDHFRLLPRRGTEDHDLFLQVARSGGLLCLAAGSPAPARVVLRDCARGDPTQIWQLCDAALVKCDWLANLVDNFRTTASPPGPPTTPGPFVPPTTPGPFVPPTTTGPFVPPAN